MHETMEAIDLKKIRTYARQYVNLRNACRDMLLTREVTVDETLTWLDYGDVDIRCIVQHGILLGAIVLYINRNGEIALFVKDRRQGIGSKLLEIIEGVARERNIENIWAWVLVSNESAQKMFLKNGYTTGGRVIKRHGDTDYSGIVFNKNCSRSASVNKEDMIHTQATYGIRPEALEFPMMCVLSFVYVCNARCPSCPYTNSDIRNQYQDRPLMREDTFKTIADQCGQYNAWVRISGGGEPMLHPKAVELFEYAKKAGAKVGLITNGSRFSEENSRRLLKAGVDMIEFSVDAADATTYARVRKGLRWNILVRNIKRMVALRNEMRSPTKIIASGVNQAGIDIDKVAEFWGSIVDNFQKRKYLTWGINDPSQSADPAPYLSPEEHIPCPFIFERLNIDSRGKVMVCGFDIAATTDMGDIHERTIRDIWHGEEFEYYRKMHLANRGHEILLCKNCPDWQYRSWKHNYWKLVKNTEERRRQRFERLTIEDIERCIADNDNKEK